LDGEGLHVIHGFLREGEVIWWREGDPEWVPARGRSERGEYSL